MNSINENICLEKLLNIKDISVKTYNICKYNNLVDLETILKHFLENGNFNKNKNFCSQTNKELLDVCNKYNYLLPRIVGQPTDKAGNNVLNKNIENLSSRQEIIINTLIFSKFQNLSSRSSKALSEYLYNSINLKSLNENIFKLPLFNISVLKNIGISAENEINTFLKDVKDFIEHISKIKEKGTLNKELLIAFLTKQFSVSQETINAICNDYDFNNGIPIFKTIHYLIEHNYIFKKKEKVVFNSALGFFVQNTPNTLKSTSEKIGLTKERTRQIRIILLKKLDTVFNLFSELDIDSINLYGINLNNEFIYIDNQLSEEILKTESVNYNILFINRFLAKILYNSFSLVGDDQNIVFRISKRNLYNWKTTYLVSKSICSIFDFEKLVYDVDLKLSKKISKTYKLDLQSYLHSFKATGDIEHPDSVLRISKHILFNEFGLITDKEENLILKRNTQKLIIEYIIEILEEANKPLTNHEIFERLNKTKPGIVKNLESVRSNSIKESKIICFGRTSTYGLKSWENREDNIKGGTMHDIAEEYLLKYNTPKHIDEIAEYVNIFRNNISSRNLLDNLKSARNRRFVFFESKHIGSCKKKYENFHKISLDIKKITMRSWEENFKTINEFVTKNNRLPYSSGCNDEKKLYRFLNTQIRKLDKLDKANKEKIRNLLTKYKYQKGEKHINEQVFDRLYESLIKFINEHKRVPIATNENEKALYDFFNSQRKLFHEKRIPKKYGNQFLKIIRLINELDN